MKRLSIFFGVCAALFVWGCSEMKDWSDPKDDIPPGVVTDIRVENINGGAILYYKLPADDDLLAVKAVYSFYEDSETREAYASIYNDSIRIEGFPDIAERTVYLHAVDKSGNESLPVEAKIKPFDPPVEVISQSLDFTPAFGGVFLSWVNEQEDEIALTLYVQNEKDEYEFYDAYYSQAVNGKYTFRGFEDVPHNFRVEIRDKWGNYSQPRDTVITPLFEERIVGRDQSGYIWQRWGYDDRSCIYRGDVVTQESGSGRQFNIIHDGNTWNNSEWWHTQPNKLNDYVDWPVDDYHKLPMYFTIDMVKMASYSRFKYWMRSRSPIFSAQTFTSLEVWGTNNPKPLSEIGDGSKEQNLMYWTEWPEVEGSGEWRNDWVKLADYVLVLPSGNTDPDVLTDEDRSFIQAGFEVEIGQEYANTPFRYLRFVIRENREPNFQIQLSELQFWGAYEKE